MLFRSANSKPSILFGGAADNYLDIAGRPLTKSVFSTLQASNTNFETLICDTTDNSPRLTTNNAANNRAYKFEGFGTPSVNIDGVTYNGTSSASSFGFHLLGMTSVTGSAIDRIGANPAVSATGNSFNFVSELILYPDDQSDNRTALEANIGETYNIDLPSGVDTGYEQVDGFVETWYDQSGNGNDAVQATTTAQPKIVDGGSLVSGGLDFDGVDDFFNTAGLDSAFRDVSNAFLFSVSSHDSAASATECLIYGQAGSNSGLARVFVGSVGTNDVAAGRRLDADSFVQSTTAKTSGAKIRSANFDWSGGNVQLFENGTGATATAFSSGAGSTSDTINSPFRIGRLGAASSYWNGTADEIILYLSDQSANRTVIEPNINNHYDIYA